VSVRVVSIRNEDTDDGHIEDWIVIGDTIPYSYNGWAAHIHKPGSGAESFTFPGSPPNVKFPYKLEETVGDGGASLTFRLSNYRGNAYTFTLENLRRARRKQAAALGDQFFVGGNLYYIVPQRVGCLCNQMLEIKEHNEAGNVVGLACAWRTSKKNLELINGGDVELGYVMGPPDYFCVRARSPSGSGWEAYTGGTCRPHMDNPKRLNQCPGWTERPPW
jgi:hypothetical protein